jgi:uncharacterized protein YhaN
MRLRRLDLTRYGKFTNHSIDFGEPVEGRPDLHIVYGLNEAGKSTALAGFLDLLFGIEMQSRYGFLHPYATMCVGGCLDLSVGRRDLVRIKRPQPTLRNAANEPLPEALILGDLGGIDRNAYRTMFLLDDDTLEAGGKSILASNGELGQLLFSASAGLADLSKTLLDLRAEMDGFTKPGARSGALAQYKVALATLRQEREAIDTFATEYRRLVETSEAAAAQYAAGLEERSRSQAALTQKQRLLAAAPVMAALRQNRKKLSEFGDLPLAPPGWLEELPALQQAETKYQTEVEFTEREVRRLAEEASAIVIDEPALQLVGRLDRLEQLRVRFIGAEADLPDRWRELAAVEQQIARLLAHLGLERETAPERLVLPAAQSAALGTLIAARSGIQEKVATASDELAQAMQELTESRRALAALTGTRGSAPPLMPISIVLAAIRDSDHAVRLRTAKRALTQTQGSVPAAVAALAPWRGSLEDLPGLTVPDIPTVQAWQGQEQKLALLVEQRLREFEQAESDLANRRAEIDAMGKIGGLLSDAEAAEIRAAREAAWSAHRRALNLETADAFETALRKDDIVGTARLGHERELAKLNGALQALAVDEVKFDRTRSLLDEARAAQRLHNNVVSGAVLAISSQLPESMAPASLLLWIGNREKALEVRGLQAQAQRDLDAAEADEVVLRDRLLAALEKAGVPQDTTGTLEDLAASAQSAVDLEAQVKILREATEACERQVGNRELAVQKASTADKIWTAGWRDACAACWLGAEAADLPVEAVREMLDAAARLAPLLTSKTELQSRITAMEEDRFAFAEEVAGRAADLGHTPTSDYPLDVAQAVTARVAAAGRAVERERELEEAGRTAEQKRKEVAAGADIHSKRVAEMTGYMQADSLVELASKLSHAETKAGLERQVDQAERDVLATLRVEALADAEALLAEHEVPQLETDVAALSAQLEDLETRTRELFAAKRSAEDRIAAVGGDDAVARIEERRRTTLLEIEEKAMDYLRLRAGTAAADRGLRLYRDQHRSSMMAHASEAFRVISRGAYRGLGIQPERDGDILVALGADGGSKLATDLSKGTRFQLYLALRAAGYQEFARLRRPVPFIADDIMETFDDLRAAETLRVLGSMALLGQVIYLTHHDHLRAIAEATVPSVQIHRLPD